MREILFRGKRIGNSEWVYGYYVPVCFGRFPCKPAIVPESDGTWEPIEVKKETVGQYIGLTDKNGKKIFEGDICNISIPRIDGGFNRHNKCLCSYEDGMYKFSSYSDIYFCMGNGYGYPDTCHQNIEVIGNIHDNPELLEEKE